MLVALVDHRVVFERIIRDHQAGVWRYLRYLGCSPPEADDLTQESFLAAWKSVQKGEFVEINEVATAGFLRTVAKSRFLMAIRAKGRRITEADTAEIDADWVQLAGATGEAEWDERMIALEHCLQHLGDRAKTVLELLYRNELTQVEIAHKLEMKPEGVRTLLKRLLAKLRECMEGKLNWPATNEKNS